MSHTLILTRTRIGCNRSLRQSAIIRSTYVRVDSLRQRRGQLCTRRPALVARLRCRRRASRFTLRSGVSRRPAKPRQPFAFARSNTTASRMPLAMRSVCLPPPDGPRRRQIRMLRSPPRVVVRQAGGHLVRGEPASCATSTSGHSPRFRIGHGLVNRIGELDHKDSKKRIAIGIDYGRIVRPDLRHQRQGRGIHHPSDLAARVSDVAERV